MTNTYIKSGAITIESITLLSLDGKRKHNLVGMISGFDIFEDIMFPVIRASFYVNDSLDVLNSFPIIGQERIFVSFSIPGDETKNSYVFDINSVENQINAPNSKSKVYVIHGISTEFKKSNKQLVNKKYSTEATDIVQNVLTEIIQTKKKINIGDKTKGIQEVLVSRLRPFQAIDMIRKRSVSEKYLSSSYCFFENKYGFNFCSIEFLFDQLKNKAGDRIFFYDTATNTDAKNMSTRSILSLINLSQTNDTKKISQGSLHNVVKRFDIFTGEVTETVFKNSEKQSQFKFPTDKPKPLNSPDYDQKYGDTPAVTMLVPFSSHLPETFTNEAIGARQSFATKVSQNLYRINVYGDPTLTAGVVITIKIPTPTGDTDQQKENRLISGNYLVSKLRHSIICGSDKERAYWTSMELIKGAYEDYA